MDTLRDKVMAILPDTYNTFEREKSHLEAQQAKLLKTQREGIEMIDKIMELIQQEKEQLEHEYRVKLAAIQSNHKQAELIAKVEKEEAVKQGKRQLLEEIEKLKIDVDSEYGFVIPLNDIKSQLESTLPLSKLPLSTEEKK